MNAKLDSKLICRSCLEPLSRTSYSLTGPLVNVEVNILTMLEFCISSKLDLSEDLPDTVCLPCFKTIRIAYRFFKQFYEAQTQLMTERKTKSDQIQSDDNTNAYITENILVECTEISRTKYSENFLSLNNYRVQVNTPCDIKDENSDFVFEIREPEEEIRETQEDIGEPQEEIEHPQEKTEESHEEMDKLPEKIGVDFESEFSEEEFNETVKKEIEENNYENESDNTMEEEDNNEQEYTEENPKIEDNWSYEHQEDTQEFKEDESGVSLLNLKNSSLNNPNIEVIIDTKSIDERTFKYICPLCGQKFCRGETFYTHVLNYNLSKITCPRCPTKPEFEIEEYFTHYVKYHSNQCDVCGKVMSSSYGYYYHMKHHQNVRHYKCPMDNCQRSFLMNHHLKQHIKSHLNYIFPCPYEFCEATFRTKDSLRYHRKLHEGKKDYLCTICGRAFSQAVHLRDHMYRHEGYKKFICEICGKGFVTNGSLKKHNLYCARKHSLT